MSNSSLKIQLFQINFTVGDLAGNCQKILTAYKKASDDGVDLAVFSELALTGYPPEDLLNRKYFLHQVNQKIAEIKLATKGSKTAILFGAPYFQEKELSSSGRVIANAKPYNSAFVIEDDEIVKIASKTCLPNYGVFDEHRYFKASPTLTNFEFRGYRLVILICEDIWHHKNAFLLGDKEFDAIISINASPFMANKAELRLDAVKKFIKELRRPVFYLNQIGAQDGLVFDGGSFILNEDAKVILKMKEFEEDQTIINFSESYLQVQNNEIQNSSKESRIYNAIILGLRDYIHKNNFKKVIIGMSGGIDSALVATIAVDALGSKNVKLVALPTKYNSQTSMHDALDLAKNLDVELEIINIENVVESMNKALEEQFKDTKKDVTEENIQSRIRGNILMALSNKFGNLLLSTGNKSEIAVGYATLYGDMCGAFNPIKDIYKTEVFALAKWRNENIPALSIYQKKNLISHSIITKEPSAELSENQKDSDSLPPYEILDKILFAFIEEEKSLMQIIESGFETELVNKVAKLLVNSEYKRRQAVIGPKVSAMSFDRDRRYPITSGFKY